MVIVARNVPSEASLKCPICEKKYKIRTTKKHVKDVHGLSITYTCVHFNIGVQELKINFIRWYIGHKYQYFDTLSCNIVFLISCENV